MTQGLPVPRCSTLRSAAGRRPRKLQRQRLRLAPLGFLRRAGQRRGRRPGHRRGLERFGEPGDGEGAPCIGHGRVPGAAPPPAEGAAHQARQVVAPALGAQQVQDEAHRVGVRRGHQPPQLVGTLGREAHRRALHVEACPHDLLRLALARPLVGDAVHRVEDGPPVEQRRGRPQVGLDGEAAEQAGVGGAGPRQGRDGGELAQGQIRGAQLGVADDAPFDELAQPLRRLLQQVGGQHPAGRLGNRQHVAGENLAALGGGREVLQQAVRIEVRRQGGDEIAAHSLVAEGDGARDLLLQTRVGIGAHPVAHATERRPQARVEGEAHPAAPGERVLRLAHGLPERALQAQQRRLQRPHRHGRAHRLG